MSLSVEILNTIRNNADTEYQTRVPVATKDNIADIGRAFQTYSLAYNTFIESLIHKIGLTLLQTKSFENKLARFKSGTILTEQDIEEIWVDQFRVAEGAYDPNGGMGTNGIHPLKRRTYQDVKVHYHRQNRQDKYVITIGMVDVIRAFRSESTLNAFLTAQFNSIYTGAEFDEFVHMKQLFAEAIQAKRADKTTPELFVYEVPEIDGTSETAKSFIRTAKKAVKDMEYPSTLFNPAGVKTFSKASELVMFVNKDVAVHMDVDFYSQIFGPNYAKMNIEVVELDNFGSDDSGTYAIICDKDWFKVYDTLNVLEDIKNPDGLYKSYWLHIWQILSYSKFKNAVRIAKKAV